jgi:hypothetical protein
MFASYANEDIVEQPISVNHTTIVDMSSDNNLLLDALPI